MDQTHREPEQHIHTGQMRDEPTSDMRMSGYVRREEMALALAQHGERYVTRALGWKVAGAIGAAIMFGVPIGVNLFGGNIGSVEKKTEKNADQLATMAKEAAELAAQMRAFIAKAEQQQIQAAQTTRDVASLSNQVSTFVGSADQRFRFLEKQVDDLSMKQRDLASYVSENRQNE